MNRRLELLLERYEEFLLVDKGSSQNTLDSYGLDLRRYLGDMTGRGIESIEILSWTGLASLIGRLRRGIVREVE